MSLAIVSPKARGPRGLVLTEPLNIVRDPNELTPVQDIGDLWLKRDDLFDVAGVRGSKARTGLYLLQGARGCTVAGNRHSPMVSRVARIAQYLDIPCSAFTAGSKALSVEEQDAVAHGAQLVKGRAQYLSALTSIARREAEKTGWVWVPLGTECQAYIDQNKRQVANLPAFAHRIVVPVGSGMALAAILHGLKQLGFRIPILGVVVGMNPERVLKKWSPEGWEKQVKLVRADSNFERPATESTIEGIQLDPWYEAKCLPHLESGDVLWSVAIRSSEVER